MTDPYLQAALERLCAEDEDIAEQGIHVEERDGTIVLSGDVASEERRRLIGERVAAQIGDRRVRNDITVLSLAPPTRAEQMQ